MIMERAVKGNPGTMCFRINSKADLPSMRTKAINLATQNATANMKFNTKAVKQLESDLKTKDVRLFACLLDYYFGRGSIIYTGDLFKGYDTYKGWKIREGWNNNDDLLRASMYRDIYETHASSRITAEEPFNSKYYRLAESVRKPQ